MTVKKDILLLLIRNKYMGENVGIFLEGAAGYDVGVGDVLER